MKNILGTNEDLKLYNSNGTLKYSYSKDSEGHPYEYTYDSNGNNLTFENSKGRSTTYDKDGNELTFKKDLKK